uniref:Uncharacterized protein n=1 Tax=Leersia perrieri TaxID=77586 RepID=A0A0D9W7U4_9ORYZ
MEFLPLSSSQVQNPDSQHCVASGFRFEVVPNAHQLDRVSKAGHGPAHRRQTPSAYMKIESALEGQCEIAELDIVAAGEHVVAAAVEDDNRKVSPYGLALEREDHVGSEAVRQLGGKMRLLHPPWFDAFGCDRRRERLGGAWRRPEAEEIRVPSLLVKQRAPRHDSQGVVPPIAIAVSAAHEERLRREGGWTEGGQMGNHGERRLGGVVYEIKVGSAAIVRQRRCEDDDLIIDGHDGSSQKLPSRLAGGQADV